MERRRQLPFGWATVAKDTRDVELGDHYVPERIEVDCPSVDGQPRLELSLAIVEGRPQCRQLQIASDNDGREVRQLDLDAVHLNAWIEEIFAAFARPIIERAPGYIVVADVDGEEHEFAAVAAMQRARRGKGARRIDRAFLERVAAVYRENIDGNPTKAVEQAFNVGSRQAANYVQLCRPPHSDPPLLPPTSVGRKRA
jgi:hypothetical protein